VTSLPSPSSIDRSFGDPSTEFDYPDAVHPPREYHLDADGLKIAVHEWGDDDAPPLLLVHGGFDFARTFDVFAPKLAAGGWRVVGWDQRGHGDSEHPELYSWDADMRDALAVFDHVSPGRPLPVVGHSKGGALMTQLADAQPFRFTHLVNMDGIPYNRRIPDVAEHERTKMVSAEIAGWLDHRRSTATAQRKPGTIEELAARRGRMNPRLDPDWLKRLVTTGGFESDDGWRWKIDPSMRFGGFGPWRPEWTLMRLPGLPMPFLGVLGREMEEMGWGTPPEKVLPYMPLDGRCEILDDVGHFVHIERPGLVAAIVLDFIGDPGAATTGAGS
jgi:pimeloyl-ACP methyl ester carboxylesterase